MPLRDHFRPPVDLKHSWDKLHGMWPAVIVQQLYTKLPPGYMAGPNIHLGVAFEVDIGALTDEDLQPVSPPEERNGGGVATAVWAPAPTFTQAVSIPEQDEYEVRIYDEHRNQKLVAAIEIVSPSNKDRPESRREFVAKVATLLKHDVCVSIVDLVSVRQFNLYEDLLDLMGQADPTLESPAPFLYAVTLRQRGTRRPKRHALETWFYPMSVGQALPTLPIWLDVRLAVPLDLEASYEDACRVLRIT